MDSFTNIDFADLNLSNLEGFHSDKWAELVISRQERKESFNADLDAPVNEERVSNANVYGFCIIS